MYNLEGAIGVGKTTFLRLIQAQLPQVSVVYEPVHNWQSQVYGQSILSNFYKDPQRWAYTMETLAMACRVQEHLKEQEDPNLFRIVERSIYSGHYVFATNGYESGFLSELEWNMYLQWFNFLVTGHCKAPQGFIYLHVDPEVALERIKKRNRVAEKNISIDYIKKIHDCHQAFLIKKQNVLPELRNVPVLVLDCNQEFEEDPAQFMMHAQAVADFMQATSIAQQPSFGTITAL